MSAVDSGKAPTPCDVFDQMLCVLDRPGKWQPGRIARRADGTGTHSTDLLAVSWSLPGAMLCALAYFRTWPAGFGVRVEKALTKAAGGRLDLFEEGEGRSYAEIVAVIGRAKALSEAA